MLRLLVLLAAFGGDPEPRVAPLALTPEMRVWVDRRVPRSGSPEVRWQRLGNILTHSMTFFETPLVTVTAAEAFARRRVNCVAFAHLAVGLAREADLDAFFVLVDNDARSRRRGDLRVVEKHLAAAFGSGGRVSVLDLGGWRRASGRARPVSDRTARAIFYSNQGAERLLAGAPEEAGAWLRAAVHLDPGLAQAWVNLGVAERRAGRRHLAALAYNQALTLEPELVPARDNLAVLRGIGRPRPVQ